MTSRASIVRRLSRESLSVASTMSVAEALEIHRKAYGLTAYEFAAALGMRGSHYSGVIRGKHDLPIKAVKRAFALGVPALVLLQQKKS